MAEVKAGTESDLQHLGRAGPDKPWRAGRSPPVSQHAVHDAWQYLVVRQADASRVVSRLPGKSAG